MTGFSIRPRTSQILRLHDDARQLMEARTSSGLCSCGRTTARCGSCNFDTLLSMTRSSEGHAPSASNVSSSRASWSRGRNVVLLLCTLGASACAHWDASSRGAFDDGDRAVLVRDSSRDAPRPNLAPSAPRPSAVDEDSASDARDGHRGRDSRRSRDGRSDASMNSGQSRTGHDDNGRGKR